MRDDEIDAQLIEDPALSDRAIAQLVGVDRQRVSRRRRALEDAGKIRAVRVVRGLDGERHRVRRSPRQRKSRKEQFTPAQLQWLTNAAEPNANEFELIELELPLEPEALEAVDDLIVRAQTQGIICGERADELREPIRRRWELLRKHAPLHPCWAQQQRQQRRPKRETVVPMRPRE